nr:immunoglobulin light chain junction region [Macaca mulatta]MOX11874.1 immunoglobulin light chain junction region [Macaca mulatta]MOX12038.1 immunoglobulin light chain junction region [Macaca mulatta]MOX12592.1 immunoglobulin light chain junction region [Macaca mulatta]MOX12656.1 immunoglobulin light chain junction region [Macaca mulatta]
DYYCKIWYDSVWVF